MAASATWGGDRRRFLRPGPAAEASRLDGSSLRRKGRRCPHQKGARPPPQGRWSPLQAPGEGLDHGSLSRALTATSPPRLGPRGPKSPSPAGHSLAPCPALGPTLPTVSCLGMAPPGRAAGQGWGFSLIFSTSCVRPGCWEFGELVPDGAQPTPGGSPAALGTGGGAGSDCPPQGSWPQLGSGRGNLGAAVAPLGLSFPRVKQPTASSSPWGCLGLRHRSGGPHPRAWKPWADVGDTAPPLGVPVYWGDRS